MTANELRKKFLRFYERLGHLTLPSSSLIPQNDPTLLLTNSGMAQFKAYFSGEKSPPSKRITTVQKCFRTTDIEEVGDTTHLTLFEMLGNFSFGDYFKEEASKWALELMTEELALPFERLFFTVHTSDEEEKEIWISLGVPEERIYTFGDEDNWWGPAGEEGPCGPCSEIHFFTGATMPENPDRDLWRPNLHSGFVELYNLVFTQFYRDIGKRDVPLPQRNIDTGMGLERTLCVLNNLESPYEVEPLASLVRVVNRGKTPVDVEALRVIADHGRAAAFLIGDGVSPEATGRGYVLRRLIRRAMMFIHRSGILENSLELVAESTAEAMGDAYPELRSNLPFITQTLEDERISFMHVLGFGSTVLRSMIDFRRNTAAKLPSKEDLPERVSDHGDGQSVSSSWSGAHSSAELLKRLEIERPRGNDVETIGQRAAYHALEQELTSLAEGSLKGHLKWPRFISGNEVFMLYDTYGFPIEMTRELVSKNGLEDIDAAGFYLKVKEQQIRSKGTGSGMSHLSESKIYSELGLSDTRFVGYETVSSDGRIVALIKEERPVKMVEEGEEVQVVLDITPFYAERGGQIGDAGVMSQDENLLRVDDVKSSYGRLNVHFTKVERGRVRVGDTVLASVDKNRRERIRRNHTATHLLHAALREIVGMHVRQSGSIVHPDYLRFDFTHSSPLTLEQIRSVNERVNERIRENLPVTVEYTTYMDALADGALAFFGDTYENEVRTIKIDGSWSYELCGGTHMDFTGGIGFFFITSETGIGAGMRRIFALTGEGAEEELTRRLQILEGICVRVKSPIAGVVNKVDHLTKELTETRKKNTVLEDDLLNATLNGANGGDSSLSRKNGDSSPYQFTIYVKGSKLEIATIRAQTAQTIPVLRKAADFMRSRMHTGVVVAGNVIDGRPVIIVMTQNRTLPSYTGMKLDASEIALGFAKLLRGGGGGNSKTAQAGGRDPSLLDKALAEAENLIRRSLGVD